MGKKVLVEGRNWCWLQDKVRELVEFLSEKVKISNFSLNIPEKVVIFGLYRVFTLLELVK